MIVRIVFRSWDDIRRRPDESTWEGRMAIRAKARALIADAEEALREEADR